jgi:hypothetical protein
LEEQAEMTGSAPRFSMKKRVVFSIVLIACLLVTVELLAYATCLAISHVAPHRGISHRATILARQSAALRQFLDHQGVARDVLDPDLGWRYRSGFRSPTDRINSQGLRALREYSSRPAPGIFRVAAFGDSYVYGTEVPDGECWAARIEELDPGIEVLNYGVGGYGVDQA